MLGVLSQWVTKSEMGSLRFAENSVPDKAGSFDDCWHSVFFPCICENIVMFESSLEPPCENVLL